MPRCDPGKRFHPGLELSTHLSYAVFRSLVLRVSRMLSVMPQSSIKSRRHRNIIETELCTATSWESAYEREEKTDHTNRAHVRRLRFVYSRSPVLFVDSSKTVGLTDTFDCDTHLMRRGASKRGGAIELQVNPVGPQRSICGTVIDATTNKPMLAQRKAAICVAQPIGPLTWL